MLSLAQKIFAHHKKANDSIPKLWTIHRTMPTGLILE